MDVVENFEYRFSVIFPAANVFAVDDILNFISAVEHHLDSKEWNEAARKEFKEDLIDRILKSVIEGKFELWNMALNKVEPPPIDKPSISANVITDFNKPSPVKAFKQLLTKIFVLPPPTDSIKALKNPPIVSDTRRLRRSGYKTAHWWTKMTYIYRSDLVKFCKAQRILASFEDDGAGMAEQTGCDHGANAKLISKTDSNNQTVLLNNSPLLKAQLEASPASIYPLESKTSSKAAIVPESHPEAPRLESKPIDKEIIASKKDLARAEAGYKHPSFINFNNLPDDTYVPMEVVCALFGCSESTIVRRTKAGILKKHSMGIRDAKWNVGELRVALKKN